MSYNVASPDLKKFYGSFLAEHKLECNSELMGVFDFEYYELNGTANYKLFRLLDHYIEKKANSFFSFDKTSGLFSYLPADKITRVIDEYNVNINSGALTSYSFNQFMELLSPFFNNRFRVSAKPIKVLRLLLKLHEKQLAILGDLFEQFVKKINSDITNVTLVNGEAIRNCYNESNYYNKGGSLGESCMRYDGCRHFLNIYVENPNQIQLAVYYINGKVAGRCLIWDNKYYDRIYYNNDAVWQTMIRWAEVNNLIPAYRSNTHIEIKLDKTKFNHYPYMDSFRFITSGNKINTTNGLLKLIYTDGSFSQQYRCPKCKKYHGISDVIGYQLLGFDGCKLRLKIISTCSQCFDRNKYVRDAIYGYYIKLDNAIYSDKYEGYILKKLATENLTYKCHNCDSDLKQYNGITCPFCREERVSYR